MKENVHSSAEGKKREKGGEGEEMEEDVCEEKRVGKWKKCLWRMLDKVYGAQCNVI